MSDELARDVGQLCWIGFADASVDADLQATIEAGDCGAVILFKRNLVFTTGPQVGEVCDLDAVAELNRALHAAAPPDDPLLIAIDQEGGQVQRVRAPATHWPPMLCFDGFQAPRDEELAEAVGLALGRELAALGFDLDFAPVLDVHSNANNPIIGDRAFGRDAGDVARRGLALARGLAAAGVLACGKHFPGHGDTTTDSHLELPRIDHPRSRLDQVELLPFAAAAKANLPMLMTAHVVFSAIDADLPATLSAALVTDLLRGELAYDGLILSDDLDMKAIVDHFGVDDAAIRAITAGCDVLLLCRNLEHQRSAREALIRHAEASTDFRSRVADAAKRVRTLKAAFAQLRDAAPPPSRDVVGAWDHRRLADQLAGRA